MKWYEHIWLFPLPLLSRLLRDKEVEPGVYTWKWFPLPGVVGVALAPDVLLRDEGYATNDALMVHEWCHVWQQRRVGALAFLASYYGHFAWNYVRNAFRGEFKWQPAYRAIFWEVEARQAEDAVKDTVDIIGTIDPTKTPFQKGFDDLPPGVL